MRALKMKQLFLILFLIVGVACGKKEENRTFGPGGVGGYPGYNPNINERLTFGQKFVNVVSHPSMRCIGNVPRAQIGFTFQSTGFGAPPQLIGLTPNHDLSNINNVKTIYVGSTPENDIVVVKDYGVTKDVIISLCDIDRWGNLISNIVLMSDFYGSTVTSCSVNQISQFDFGITYPQSAQPIILQVGPMNDMNPIEGICAFDFFADPIQ